MKHVEFNDKEKIKMFDQIATCFYNTNFGQISKADMELMMFHFYINKLISKNKDEDGIIDYSKCSDYKISQDLGITQQRVRALKVKNQLKYPIKYDWKASLAKLTKNARFDKNTGKIVINIPDPNLFLEIQNFIEDNGAYIEKQLNSKVLQIRAEYYIDLIIAMENESNRKKIIKSIKKQLQEANKDETMFDENKIGESLLNSTLDITSLAVNLTGVISPGNIVGKALFDLLSQ